MNTLSVSPGVLGLHCLLRLSCYSLVVALEDGRTQLPELQVLQTAEDSTAANAPANQLAAHSSTMRASVASRRSTAELMEVEDERTREAN